MKEFLKALEESRRAEYQPQITEADKKHMDMKQKFSELTGRRALYHSKVDRDPRVVWVQGAYDHYVLLSYKWYSTTSSGELSVCCNYASLLSGEDQLELSV